MSSDLQVRVGDLFQVENIIELWCEPRHHWMSVNSQLLLVLAVDGRVHFLDLENLDILSRIDAIVFKLIKAKNLVRVLKR